MRDITEFLLSGALPTDAQLTIIEIGAHVGTETEQFRRLFPNARIIAFEPDPRNVYAFRNAGRDKLVTLVDAAVGDHDGTTTMHLSSGEAKNPEFRRVSRVWTYSSSLKAPREHLTEFPWVKFDRTATVRVVRLDTYVREQGIETIDLIWADVQGAEDQLVAGGQEALARTRYLYTEYADRELYEGQITLDQLIQRLPGRWELLAKFPEDALLRNTAL